MDALIQFSQRKEAVATQTSQYPAFNDLHSDLGFGLVLRLVGTCRYYGQLIVFCQLLIAGIEFRIISAGLADATA